MNLRSPLLVRMAIENDATVQCYQLAAVADLASDTLSRRFAIAIIDGESAV
jgi:hypothetical protein